MSDVAGIRAISRSIAVLRAINMAGSLSMMQISQACAIPYPTACRITRALIGEGLLEREPTRKKYRPTVLVKSLSHGYQDHSGLVDIARPHLVELTQEHLWPVSLVTRIGQLMIVRDCTHAISPMALSLYRAGAAFPLLECASGHCYLAFVSDEERRQLLRADLIANPEAGAPTRQAFESGVIPDVIRRAGYAARGRNRFTDTPGRTSSIAAPIFRDGEICATLTIVVFASAMNMADAVERYAPALKAAASRITAALASQARDQDAA